MKLALKWMLLSVTLIASILGCGTKPSPSGVSGPAADGSAYLLKAEPNSAKGVKEVRSGAKDADEITLVGRIGGDVNPWVEGQAAFLVVDTALKPCSENPGDSCETPWDYCCDVDDLPANKLMVKVVDASGKTVATDARKLLGLKELQTVIIKGKAKRDETGNVTILANGIFVRK